ncbi:hypothetical protein RND81_14G243900 [Saponaria officinalis]|uniref:Uncharacterized protein n=1 Tax=Saponaria officinalis TaxID=3572 RepID=A0AAW1GUS8_SAPOF
MEWFSKSKGIMSPNTRGLSDYHPHTTHSSSSTSRVSLMNHASSSPVSSSSLGASSGPPIGVPYELPHHVENNGQQEVNFFAGGNENKEGEQEIDEVEIGTSSNGVVSPIFGNNAGKFDIKIGNNTNAGGNQKVGKVKFGNVG